MRQHQKYTKIYIKNILIFKRHFHLSKKGFGRKMICSLKSNCPIHAIHPMRLINLEIIEARKWKAACVQENSTKHWTLIKSKLMPEEAKVAEKLIEKIFRKISTFFINWCISILPLKYEKDLILDYFFSWNASSHFYQRDCCWRDLLTKLSHSKSTVEH